MNIEETITVDPAVKETKQVDLTPYKDALKTILPFPAQTRAIPVVVTNERGDSANAAKKNFLEAYSQLNGQIKDAGGKMVFDTTKARLTFRNANPGVMPIKKMYVKWVPLVEKPDEKKA